MATVLFSVTPVTRWVVSRTTIETDSGQAVGGSIDVGKYANESEARKSAEHLVELHRNAYPSDNVSLRK